jgi:hypothetical protein
MRRSVDRVFAGYGRLCHYMCPKRLEQVLDRGQVCELISALISTEGSMPKYTALTLIHVLMSKAADSLYPVLAREGIAHQIQNMARAFENGSAPATASTSGACRSSAGEITEANVEAMVKYVCEAHLPKEEGADKDGVTLVHPPQNSPILFS